MPEVTSKHPGGKQMVGSEIQLGGKDLSTVSKIRLGESSQDQMNVHSAAANLVKFKVPPRALPGKKPIYFQTSGSTAWEKTKFSVDVDVKVKV
jgi:hypothetical protein